jgi:hypothetical protein
MLSSFPFLLSFCFSILFESLLRRPFSFFAFGFCFVFVFERRWVACCVFRRECFLCCSLLPSVCVCSCCSSRVGGTTGHLGADPRPASAFLRPPSLTCVCIEHAVCAPSFLLCHRPLLPIFLLSTGGKALSAPNSSGSGCKREEEEQRGDAKGMHSIAIVRSWLSNTDWTGRRLAERRATKGRRDGTH